MFFISLLAALAVLPALYHCTEECTLHQLQSCLESLQSVTQSNDLALVTTRVELQAVCSKMKESVLCVDEHMKHCFSPTQRKVFNHVVAGARQFLAELCVAGPIQEAYLRHAPCNRNVTLSESKCAPKYRHLIDISESVNEKQNVDDRLRESCCAFNEFVLCKYMFVTKDCGQEAANFLQQHLEQISSPLIHEHCAHYTYASDSCSNSVASPGLWESSFLASLSATAVALMLHVMWNSWDALFFDDTRGCGRFCADAQERVATVNA